MTMEDRAGKRFLFMEDDLAVARLLQKKLARLGYTVDHAADGEVGLKMCREQDYHLVIVDHRMPVYSGLEVIRELSNMAGAPPAIMVTGAGDESTAVQALKLGAHDYIVKDATDGYIELLPTVIDQVFHKIQLEREKREAERGLGESEHRYRVLVESAPDAIVLLRDGKVDYINRAGVKLLGGSSRADLLGASFDAFLDESSQTALAEVMSHCDSGQPRSPVRMDAMILREGGAKLDTELMAACVEIGGAPALQVVARDITGRKQVEMEISHMKDELEQVIDDQHEQLDHLRREMDAATRKLNMAQMATGALHNVKNVLNSLIVGTSMMGRVLSSSKVGKVTKVAQLLRENQSQLGAFLSEGDRGKFLPDFLTSLAQSLEKEHEMVHQELQGLTKNLEHIKFSIQLQLTSTRLSEGSEFLSVNDIIEDALKVNRSAVQRNAISVQRTGATLPPIPGNRHKVLQVLVNLISNAVNALEESPDKNRTIRIQTEMPDEDHVAVSVGDNGIGISSENLAEIFRYGFTTRETGHGFGLHSCLQLASEMGGSLTAHSDGVGKGAAFSLTLPILKDPSQLTDPSDEEEPEQSS